MATEAVQLHAISIEPNNCPLEQELLIEMEFTTVEDVKDAVWRVRVPSVDVAHLKRHVLANVGLLQANLTSGETELLQVSMVTQVTPKGDQLIRSIYNPLE
eukprot:6179699-Pleurochrysis_carterae.AAC.1